LTAGIEPHGVEHDGDNPVGYVVSQNLQRRHLNTVQRGIVAENIANLKEGCNIVLLHLKQYLKKQAADMVNVSRSTVQRISKVKKKGTIKLLEAVKSREVPPGRYR
jgi:predicted DNA-binding protein (UPF0251 family)